MILTDLSFNQFEIDPKLIRGLDCDGVHTVITTAYGDKLLVMESIGAIIKIIYQGRK